jgi:hypothetical protein
VLAAITAGDLPGRQADRESGFQPPDVHLGQSRRFAGDRGVGVLTRLLDVPCDLTPLSDGTMTLTEDGFRAWALGRASLSARTMAGTTALSEGVMRMWSPCCLTPDRGGTFLAVRTLKPMLIVPVRMPASCLRTCSMSWFMM